MAEGRFEGRVALVTGGASGIGRATAERLAREGAAVGVVDRDGDGAAAVARALEGAGAAALAVPCDVALCEQVGEAARAVERGLGPVDVLANVAGIGDHEGFDDVSAIGDESWRRTLSVNLDGPFYFCRALLPGMAERGRGAVVNVSSLAGRWKSANANAAYSASKAGLLGLTRHLALDYGRRGVRVNAICPGGVQTPMMRAAAGVQTRTDEGRRALEERLAAYRHFMPIQRLSTAEEQAAAIAFLASDDASYINGVSLDTNGGLYVA